MLCGVVVETHWGENREMPSRWPRAEEVLTLGFGDFCPWTGSRAVEMPHMRIRELGLLTEVVCSGRNVTP